jgi:hypothetical protein
MRPRDSQRSKVYRSEQMLVDQAEIAFPRMADVEGFLNDLMNTQWFRNHHERKREMYLADGRGASRARGGPRANGGVYLKLPRRYRSRIMILHELSHGLQPLGTAWHGPEFCRIYLDLVAEFCPAKDYHALRAGFDKNRVKY